MASRQKLYEVILEGNDVNPVIRNIHGMPKVFMAEVWSFDYNRQRKWETGGYMAVLPLMRTGVYQGGTGELNTIWGVDTDRVYGATVANLDAAVTAGELNITDVSRAINEIHGGIFENGDLAKYIPRPGKE